MDFNCIYLYVGLKAGDNSCKWKIFEQLKKCIMLKLNSIGKVKNTHVRVLIQVGVFILMFI